MRTFLEIGESTEYTRTIAAEDIVAFARISGDDDPVHTDPDYAAQSAFGRCIAHGAHVMGLLSTTASMMSRRSVARGAAGTPVSAGYDRIRFTRPVFAGDTLTARYVIEEVDDTRGRSRARVAVVNQDGEPCLVGSHVLAWVAPSQADRTRDT